MLGSMTPAPTMRPLRPVPRRSIRPWAGRRLGRADEHVGELWLAGPDSLVDASDGRTLTLDELAASAGEALVGGRAMRLLGSRFPLLVKVIDAAAWLSLQVHPSDELAVELYGEGRLGKTEAWLVLDAAPGTLLVTGLRRDLPEATLRRTIRDGTVGRTDCETLPCVPGDALLIEAGTVHAIGTGAFVYEIEQPSDVTFRLSDWDRPASAERPLHVAQALRAIRPERHAVPVGRDWRLDGGALSVRELRLEICAVPSAAARRPAGESLEIVTAVRGRAELSGDGWREVLEPFDTLVVPASIAEYRIVGPAGGLVCVGTVP